ncbi:angio-associated migratory cell protein-like [Actinia tenebrosa]|uniref:Angio-associated migratory cell protein n=1 Tax=Actinia tenebrosa TaxID=6105 RepID=A0A6P8HMT9_ACTTE|nr:angio-associated migratory cell protein-like [Actinia tenebrosa]
MDPPDNEDEGVGDEELVEVVDAEDEGFEDDGGEDDLAFGMEEIDIADNDSGEGDADVEIVDNSVVTFAKHTASVFSVSIDPENSSLVASGGEDDKAYVWKIADGELAFECKGHKDSVTCTAFSHDSKFVCTGDMSGVIKVWDTQSGQEVWNFETGGDLEWLEWHQLAHVLLAGTADGDVWMWKIPSGDTKTFQNHGCRTSCGLFMNDGTRASVGYADGTIKVWDLKKGTPIFHLSDSTCHKGTVTCMAAHNCDVLLATGAEDSFCKLINSNTGKVLATLNAGFPEPQEENPPSIEAVSFSNTLPLLATGSLSGVMAFWDVPTHRLRQQCKHPATVVSLKWDPTNPVIYSCCLDGIVRMWDSRSGSCEREWQGHNTEVLDLAVSRDGNKLVTGSGDSTAKVFNVQVPAR